MNPKQFLQIGGVVLVLVGVLGMVGVIGPSADRSIFGETWWFGPAENWAHLILGIAALILAYGYVVGAGIQRPVVMILGAVGVLVGVYSLLGYSDLLGANLENPADSILHILFGAWALWAAWKKQPEIGAAGGMGGVPM